MIRIYAIELEDGTYVITGGAIKISEKMDRAHFEPEIKNIKRVQEFLKEQGITTKEGLTY